MFNMCIYPPLWLYFNAGRVPAESALHKEKSLNVPLFFRGGNAELHSLSYEDVTFLREIIKLLFIRTSLECAAERP